jgi:hypothetical protein
MFVSAVTSIGAATPIRKAAKTAKVSKRAATNSDEKPRKPAKQAAKGGANREFQAASKSAEAMSSNAVKAALTFLKPGR